jgi:hypothetical protein
MAVRYTNDTKATYDLDTGQYILTPEYFTNKTGYSIIDEYKDTDLTSNKDLITENFLTLLSDVFYTHLYLHAKNKSYRRFYLTEERLRPYILKGMIMLGRAWMINRYTPSLVYSKTNEELVPSLVKQYCHNNKLDIRGYLVFDPIFDNYVEGVDY